MYIVNQTPILIALIYWKKLERVQKLFALFLCWGAIHDSKGLFDMDDRVSDHLLIFYILTEVCFYVWVMFEFGYLPFSKQVKRALLIGFPLFWFFSFFVLKNRTDTDLFSGLFDGVSAIVISSLSAYTVFKLTFSGRPLEITPTFWFAGGAFFYFFCSIFIFSIMSKEVAQNAWMVHRVINVTTMMVFAFGFYISGKNANGALG